LSSCSAWILDDHINFVLQDNDVLEFHDFYSDQMFFSLWLWAGLITSNEQQSTVHDGGTGKHGSHEHIVTWAINERDMAHEL